MKNIFLVLIVLLATNLFSESIQWPKNVSNFDNWQGFKLIKGKRCPVCYSLIIPNNYGYKSVDEFSILVKISEKRNHMNYDLAGPLFEDNDILDHLFHLAIEKQFSKAAKAILYPERYSMKHWVQSSEGIIGKYIIPLLRKYKNLNEIVKETDYERLGKRISSWSRFKRDFQLSETLIFELRSRNYKTFANKIAEMNEKEKVYMQKHGE